jgi:N-acetylmuramoyl-L-alanine amidase
MVVIHCTELPDLPTAREYGEAIHYTESQTGNSGHYYIDRNGAVELWVRPQFVAHHVRGHNAHSIGIELVNLGRYPDWLHWANQRMSEAYPARQIASLVQLLRMLKTQIPSLRHIAGHEDLDRTKVSATDDPNRRVLRKRDPGPLFPWPALLESTQLERFAG